MITEHPAGLIIVSNSHLDALIKVCCREIAAGVDVDLNERWLQKLLEEKAKRP